MDVDAAPVVVATSGDVPERGRTIVDIDGTEIGIFRLDGQLFAYANVCAHAGGPVCQGMLIPRVETVIGPRNVTFGDVYSEQDLHIVCPWHGYEYDVRTGEHPASPDVRLRSYEVSEQDGEICVRL